ncbi:peptide chain release factor 3, partial [Leifsonia sp. SIMBA_070]
WDLKKDEYVKFERQNSGASLAKEDHFTPEEALAAEGEVWEDSLGEAELVIDGREFDRDAFLNAKATPLLFSSAALNFGVKQIL